MPRAMKLSETPFMPLKLRAALADVAITQEVFAVEVCQANGERMSKSMVSLLLGRGIWPKLTPRAWIEQRSRNLLREYRSPHADDADLFELDESEVSDVAPTSPPIRRNGVTGPASPIEQDISLEPVMLSQQAKKHFKLGFVSPFIEDVKSNADVFLSADQRYVREAFHHALKHPGNIIGIIGESGSGKTTLRREGIEWAQATDLPCVIIQPRTIDKSVLSASGLCAAILGDVAPSLRPKRSIEDVARQVEKALLQSAEAGMSHTLVIEEAHDLTIPMMKLLKRFWEIENGHKKLLSVVLIGQPELRDKLNVRRYPEAREFINRCEQVELLPLDVAVGDYLEFKLARVGRKLPDVFGEGTMDAIRAKLTLPSTSKVGAESRVYPLYVNNLVTRAMNLAAQMGAPLVTADIVMGC